MEKTYKIYTEQELYKHKTQSLLWGFVMGLIGGAMLGGKGKKI